ncbi:MAG: hypothetical protein K2Q22_02970 [Cytophagales bacterium]|nr:hypothetical protein [Cytophagales bacterium]
MDNSTPSKLFFSAFRAIDDEDACKRYLEGHMRVLQIYGITQITSAKTEWMYNPNMYVILVQSENKDKVYAGSRVQIAGNEFRLPIEDAIGKMDKNIFPLIQNSIPEGCGEVCGLWNSREVAGMGIGSIFLGRASISIANQLNVNKLFALCAPATLRNCLKLGFEVIHNLGLDGRFYYPKEDLLATALIISDTKNLPASTQEERDYILSLRNSPVQLRQESYKTGEIEIDFDLRIPNLMNVTR